MDAIITYLDMAGYAAFVWPAYGVTAALLVALLVTSLRALKRGERELARISRRGRKTRA